MTFELRPSDLMYRYPKDTHHRHDPKFVGKPDPAPFNRDDIYEVLPMLAAVMNELKTNDGRILAHLEELMVHRMPAFIVTREEVFDFLVESTRDMLDCRL